MWLLEESCRPGLCSFVEGDYGRLEEGASLAHSPTSEGRLRKLFLERSEEANSYKKGSSKEGETKLLWNGERSKAVSKTYDFAPLLRTLSSISYNYQNGE